MQGLRGLGFFFLTLLVALLKGTLLRGSISPRVPLILTPRSAIQSRETLFLSRLCLLIRIISDFSIFIYCYDYDYDDDYYFYYYYSYCITITTIITMISLLLFCYYLFLP